MLANKFNKNYIWGVLSEKVETFAVNCKWDRIVSIIIFSMLLSGALLLIAWPGFMSFDSLYALRGARVGVNSSVWPPAVSYFWHVIELFWPGPSGMLFVENFILLCSIGLIFSSFFKRLFLVFLMLLLMTMLPVILGIMFVVWKDVASAALTCLAFVFFRGFQKNGNKTALSFMVCSSIVAVLLRHNAIFAVFPLYIAVSFIVWTERKRSLAVLLFIFCLTSTIAVHQFFSTYRLPDLKKFPPSESQHLAGLMLMDIVGASVCENKNLLAENSDDLAIEFIKQHYKPVHLNENALITTKIKISELEIYRKWRTILIDNPKCLLYQKLQLGKYLFGLIPGPMFYITHPSIDNNEFGYHLEKSEIRSIFINYLIDWSSSPLAKPYFYLLVSTIAAVAIFLYGQPKEKLYFLTLYFSGFLYSLCNIILVPAADLRYQFWPNVAFFIVLVFFLHSLVTLRLSRRSV